MCNKINTYHKNINNLERDDNKLKIIYSLYEYDNSIVEKDAYITDINDNKISVYIPDFKIETPCYLFSNKTNKFLKN